MVDSVSRFVSNKGLRIKNDSCLPEKLAHEFVQDYCVRMLSTKVRSV